jgi:Ca2+-transporting ATPase
MARKQAADNHEKAGEAGTPAETTYPPTLLLRSSMVMSGTGRFRVSAVGDQTEIGRVARMATELTQVKTPLNLQLSRLAALISKVGTAISVLAFAAFLLHDILTNTLWSTHDYMGMVTVVLRYFMMAVTLIVMAVPEGLPMAVTLALALNMRRMLRSGNLVRKLQASETMGAVTVICTDKTGTLTENRMRVEEMVTDDPQQLARAIALNTTAYLQADGTGIGNPTEVALLRWLQQEGFDYEQLRREAVIDERLPFSTERKLMATRAGTRVYIKGAPEIVLALCGDAITLSGSPLSLPSTRARLAEWQGHAMRTLAFAWKEATPLSIDGGFTLQAVCAIADPVRQDVPEAVAGCLRAGIDVKVVTGDVAATAIEIARQIGITSQLSTVTGPEFAALSDDEAMAILPSLKVMSRARPADKQRLVELLRRSGEVVAVTGDGTNDAPALNHAHVGLSLGSGTSVAKEASDITVIDDSFRSVERAVEWGRSLYKNIQRFIFFQLVVNVTALLLVLGGSVIGTEMPLTVTQILWVNLIMDTFAAMALASLPPSHEVMDVPPRRADDFIITRAMLRGIVGIGLLFFAVTLAYLYWLEHNAVGEGVTTHELTRFFTFFVMLQWWNLFNARALGSRHSALHHFFWCRGFVFVLALILLGQWAIVEWGGEMFRTEHLSATEWLVIILGTMPVLVVGEAYRFTIRLWRIR